MPLGAIISGGLGLVGGLLGAKSARDQQSANTAAQREFAQHGIRWKVQDAKKAGIHPLYALGAQTHQFSPNPLFQTDYGLGAAGQHLGRAIQAKQTAPERAMQNLQMQRTQAEIDLIKAQTAAAISRTVKQPGQPPVMPSAADVPGIIPGQNIDLEPARVETRMPGIPESRAGALPLYQFVQKGPNEWHYTINPKAIEPDSFQGIMATLAGVADPPKPPPGLLKPGHTWKWNRFSATWSQVRSKTRPTSNVRYRQQLRHGR
jgi:hypothetical protein